MFFSTPPPPPRKQHCFYGKKKMLYHERNPIYSLTVFKDLMNARTFRSVLRENLAGFFLCIWYVILGYMCYNQELKAFVHMFQ